MSVQDRNRQRRKSQQIETSMHHPFWPEMALTHYTTSVKHPLPPTPPLHPTSRHQADAHTSAK